MTANKRKSLSLIIVLIAILVVGATWAYFTDADVATNEFTVGDLDIKIEEPEWTPEEGKEVPPGRVIEKDPTVTAVEGNSYMRMKVEYIDMNGQNTDTGAADYNANYGKVITDTARIGLIDKTVYYDVIDSSDATTIDLKDGVKYTLDTWTVSGMNFVSLNGLVSADKINSIYNKTDFAKDTARSSAGTYYYNYICAAVTTPGSEKAANVLAEGDEATLFTHVIVPSEWTQTELELLGKYAIVIKAEAIQAEGFVDSAEAFTALDAQLIKNATP